MGNTRKVFNEVKFEEDIEEQVVILTRSSQARATYPMLDP